MQAACKQWKGGTHGAKSRARTRVAKLKTVKAHTSLSIMVTRRLLEDINHVSTSVGHWTGGLGIREVTDQE